MRGIGRAFCLKIRETRQSLRGDGATVGWWHSGTAYEYGMLPPRYPMPAKRMRTFEYWRNLGEVSALNSFDIEVVHSLNRYR